MANSERDLAQAYDAARDAWEAFQGAMWALGREVRKADVALYERVRAYPGWDGTRDVGAGQDMNEWLVEIGARFGLASGIGCESCGDSSPVDDDGFCAVCRERMGR